MKRVWAPGELLIDFYSKDGNHFTKKMGGAPANVCVGISRLGGNASMMGCLGQDAFGIFLKKTMEKEGVGISHLHLQEGGNTTLAFVANDDMGERSFTFHRGADQAYQIKQAEVEALGTEGILHLGSATQLLGGPLLRSVQALKQHAINHGWLLVVDPNYREDLFKSQKETFVREALYLSEGADLIKVSDQELALLTGVDAVDRGAKELIEKGVRHVLVTCGGQGVVYVTPSFTLRVPAIKVEVIDTTGAGDAMIASVLCSLSESTDPKSDLDHEETMKRILKRGTIAAGLTCTAYGAVEAFPSVEEIEKFERK